MIGIADGIASSIMFGLLFLWYIPFITTLGIKETGLVKIQSKLLKVLFYIFCFLTLAALTILIIRTFSHSSFDGLIIYAVLLTVILLIKAIRKTITANRNKQNI